MAWNLSPGGLDFSYSIDGSPLSAATTAKLFWANGPTANDILASAPIIFTRTVPAGASGPSGIINVPASAFSAPPPGATFVILVLDYENLVTESNKNNNVMALAWCPVGMLVKPKFADAGYDDSCLNPTLKAALACLESKVGVENIVKTSGCRSNPYQEHLREI
jgi:hypothetical protein